MNKLIFALSIILLTSCQQLQHGATQPVKLIGSNKYFTTCAGAVEDWNNCYDKASTTCNGTYDVIAREDNNRGTKRDLTFQCKK